MWTVLQNARRTLNEAMPTCRLRDLVGRAVTTAAGESIGGLEDVVMCRSGRDHPVITGIVADTAGGKLLLGRDAIAYVSTARIVLRRHAVGVMDGTLADDELLLRRDLLGRWFTERATADLVRACDMELAATDEGWALSAVYTHPPRWFGFRRRSHERDLRDWNALTSPHTEALWSPVDTDPVAQGWPGRPLSASLASDFADLLERVTANARVDIAVAVAAVTKLGRTPHPPRHTR